MNPFRPPHGVLWSRDVDNPQLVDDVVRGARYAVRVTRGGLSRASAARECWNFIRACTVYREDGPDAQIIRMPWRFVADGVGDCKSQAIYTAGVCANSGCDVQLAFATLPGDDEPGHVYAIVDGVVCDPLLHFGEEVSYIRRHVVPLTPR